MTQVQSPGQERPNSHMLLLDLGTVAHGQSLQGGCVHKIHKNVENRRRLLYLWVLTGIKEHCSGSLGLLSHGSVGVALVTSAPPAPVSVVLEAAASHPPQPGAGLPFSTTVGRFSPPEISQERGFSKKPRPRLMDNSHTVPHGESDLGVSPAYTFPGSRAKTGFPPLFVNLVMDLVMAFLPLCVTNMFWSFVSHVEPIYRPWV